MFVKRSDKNPILTPNKDQSWEAEAVFNGCPVMKDGKTFLLYRALSLPHYHTVSRMKLAVSDVGIAESSDGLNFSNRRRFVIPEHEWERFGCEDPRVTKLGDKYYTFYTALSTWPPNAEGIRVGVAISEDLQTITEKHLVTPFNAKALTLFPEKIRGKIYALLAVNTDKPPAKICVAAFEKESDIWSEAYWEDWYKDYEKYSLTLQRRPQDHVEVGSPPLKTKQGWLLFYSYIRNYFSQEPIFTVEAVLLDLNDPFKIIGRTKAPLLTPEEYYERIGMVPNIVFPSGALLEEDSIKLYYGAADTTCCVATIDTEILFEKLLKNKKPVKFSRAKENPILDTKKENQWESRAVFNPAAIYLDNKVHIIYRAMSEDNTSLFGYATSSDGIAIDERSADPIYVPREPFEQKLTPGGNSGCEDPRITKVGDKLYLLYTAYNGKNPPRVALSWITESNFLAQKWEWSKPVLISPPDLDDKDACVFPEKFNGKYFIIHRVGDDMDYAFRTSLDFSDENWVEENRWITPRKGMWDSRKVGLSAPPIKTDKGWLLFYHGVSEDDGHYRVGALLLDLEDPTKVLARSDEPLLEPEKKYEKEGQVPNVVFPCGAIVIDGTIFLYYGGGDQVVGVATMKLNDLLEYLKYCKC